MTTSEITSQQVLDYFRFTKSFRFVTPVPPELCAERLGELPFNDGKHKYTVELEPVGGDYQFNLWVGNKYQREPNKARCVGSGWIKRQGDETLVYGDIKIGLNRMLMLNVITLICGIWTIGLLTLPAWFIYLIYTGGIPIFAPLYLYWKTLQERNEMVEDVKSTVTPYLSDRRGRLSQQQYSEITDEFSNPNAQSRRRQR